ncbi:MAG TPA: two-component regulator propeller domain-containing protein [Candidatus Krumholzibacteria bacterium]|nr:two-component regulator propeller domain-containing protein [Candidatus Krumholzibacteria bacterium]HPD71544.1 two-component regulator propeller domain-containing protein [Candidatus Krumholzibacteria bacterium]HRY41523.1 two-component regulator propeller domain-containing protein [Candidatus Krumholzibacteria bacterium]
MTVSPPLRSVIRRQVRPLARSAIALAAVLAGPALAGTWTTYTDAAFVSGLAVRGDVVWAGTSGGLVRWDVPAATYVKTTTSEGLADQDLKECFVDAGGRLWVGSTAGVQRFDGAGWTTYNSLNSPLPDDRVYGIAQDLDGAMWFGTGNGCARLAGTTWEVFTDLGGGATAVAVRGIGVDSQGRVWTANNPTNYGAPGGVSRYDGAIWTRFDPDPGSIGQYFLCLAVDELDRVWAGSFTHGAFLYDGSVWTIFNASNSGLTGNIVEAIGAGAGPVVWVANHASAATPANSGVARYEGASWQTFTPGNSGLTDTHVYAIVVADGTTWLGTSRYGVESFDGVAWTTYDTAGEPHTNWITGIVEGQVGAVAGLYIGTDHSGVAIWDGVAWSSLTTQNSGLGDDYVNDLIVRDGVLWIGSQFSGLWRFDGATWVNYTTANSSLLGDTIVSLDSDSQGNLWLGTTGWDGPSGQDGALARFDGADWTNYYLANSGLIDDDAMQVEVDRDDIIWIGTEEGVSRFDGGTGWTSYDSATSGLAENHVGAIAFDDESGTWFATRGGASRLLAGAWTTFTTADGLPGNLIQALAVAPDGAVWVGTATGVARLAEGSWTAYHQMDGLADDDVTAIWPSGAGPVWFGTERCGLSGFVDDATAASDPVPGAAARLALRACPSPFNPTTMIAFDLPAAGRIRLTAHDVRGRLVAVIADGEFGAGHHEVRWEALAAGGPALASGPYVLRLDGGAASGHTKVVLIK